MYDMDEYQVSAQRTAIYPAVVVANEGENRECQWVYPALKLCGEAGEVAEKLGKIIRDKKGEMSGDDRAALLLELGDVLWYVAALASNLGFSLSDVAKANIAKLASRAERGKIHGDGDKR